MKSIFKSLQPDEGCILHLLSNLSCFLSGTRRTSLRHFGKETATPTWHHWLKPESWVSLMYTGQTPPVPSCNQRLGRCQPVSLVKQSHHSQGTQHITAIHWPATRCPCYYSSTHPFTAEMKWASLILEGKAGVVVVEEARVRGRRIRWPVTFLFCLNEVTPSFDEIKMSGRRKRLQWDAICKQKLDLNK